MLEATTALDSLLAYYGEIKHESTHQIAEKLYEIRISSREEPSSLPWLNKLLKAHIHEQEHHVHPMYMDLLANHLDRTMLEDFISEYYWGSGYGFQREVINLVYKSTPHQAFRNNRQVYHAFIGIFYKIRVICLISDHQNLHKIALISYKKVAVSRIDLSNPAITFLASFSEIMSFSIHRQVSLACASSPVVST